MSGSSNVVSPTSILHHVSPLELHRSTVFSCDLEEIEDEKAD